MLHWQVQTRFKEPESIPQVEPRLKFLRLENAVGRSSVELLQDKKVLNALRRSVAFAPSELE